MSGSARRPGVRLESVFLHPAPGGRKDQPRGGLLKENPLPRSVLRQRPRRLCPLGRVVWKRNLADR